MKIHKLKTWTVYFNEVLLGHKTFEVRKNDRDFKTDDYVILQEWNNDTQEFTGREIARRIGYILYGGQFGIEDGYCVMQLN